MKTTKIRNGNYKGTYKGQNVKVCRITTDDNKTNWYCVVNEANAEDWVCTKREAISDAMYMIDNASEYGIELV